MKTIDIKSLLIGILATATIFLGIAATSPTDKWDGKQKWEIRSGSVLREVGDVEFFDAPDPRIKEGHTVIKGGWEPFSTAPWVMDVMYRRRIK